MPTSYYPQHEQPQNDVHRSFVAQDGSPIADLTPAIIDRLTSIISSLRDPRSLDNDGMQYWQSIQWFEGAAFLLLAYFGVEDHTCEVSSTKGSHEHLRRFQVDAKEVKRLLGLDWPSWGEWTGALQEAEESLEERCHQLGAEAPDWKYIWWRQGVAIKEHHGYRLRPLPEQRGHTHFDKCIHFLEGRPTWIGLLEQWASALAQSEFLSMIVTNGDLSHDGVLIRREAVELQQAEIRAFFKIEEKVYTTFRRELWPIIMQPLLRRALALHSELSSMGQAGAYYQSPWMASMPEEMDPGVGHVSLMVATTTREIRETIGSTLEVVTKLRRTASYTANTSAKTALLAVLESEESRLAVYRNVANDTLAKLHDVYESSTSPNSSPTRIAVAQGSMLSYGAHSLGVENVINLDTTDSDDVPGQADNAFQLEDDEEDTFGIRETTLSLPGDDLGPLLDNIRGESSGADEMEDEPAVIDRYRGYLSDDLATLSNGNIHQRWQRLAQAISLQIRAAPHDDTRESGLNKLWYRPGLGKKPKKEMRDQGGVELREIRRFNKESASDNAFCIGILLHNSRDIIPSGLAERYINGLSLLLATMYMSKRPYLYITQLDHLLDQTTLEYSMVTGEGVDPGALGTLSAVGNFANGIGIAAAVGSRTLQGGRHFMFCIRTWIRALLFPIATVRGWAFGTGARLACGSCGSEVRLMSPDEAPTSGLPGVFRSIRLVDRLSVSIYAVRRGTNASYTWSAGRTAYYDCLVQLFLFWFHPSFVIVFLYFACIVHYQDKARRGKTVIGLTENGFRSFATL